MGNCQGQSCSTHSGSSQGSCGSSGCSSCGCKSSSCGCSCHQKSCGGCGCQSCGKEDKAKKLLAVADMAWMEVLKEKIKEHIKASDHKIDEMARIISEANHDRWQHKMAKQACCNHYEEQLEHLMDQQHAQSHVHGNQPMSGSQPGSQPGNQMGSGNNKPGNGNRNQ